MDFDFTVMDVVYVAVVALIFALLDNKVKWLRLGKLYRENFIENFVINFLVIGAFALIFELLF